MREAIGKVVRHAEKRPEAETAATATAATAAASAGGDGDEAAFLRALKAFQWRDDYHSRFEKGEFSHWLELFNCFDDWFEKHLKHEKFTLLWPSEDKDREKKEGAAGKASKRDEAEEGAQAAEGEERGNSIEGRRRRSGSNVRSQCHGE